MIKYYFRPKKVGKISHKLTFGLLNRHGIAGWPKDPNEHLSFAFVCTGKLFLNILIGVNKRTLTYLAPSIHWKFGISIFKLNVKMASEMSGFFNWLPLYFGESDLKYEYSIFYFGTFCLGKWKGQMYDAWNTYVMTKCFILLDFTYGHVLFSNPIIYRP